MKEEYFRFLGSDEHEIACFHQKYYSRACCFFDITHRFRPGHTFCMFLKQTSMEAIHPTKGC